MYIADQKTRKLLAKYATDKLSIAGDDTTSEMVELIQLLRIHQPSLLPPLQRLQDDGHVKTAPSGLRRFLTALSKNTSVAGLLHGDVIKVLEDIVLREENPSQKPEVISQLQELFPALYSVISEYKVLPREMFPIMTELVKKFQDTFAGRMPHPLKRPSGEDPLSWFPVLTRHCERGSYSMDTKKEEVQSDCDKLKISKQKQRQHFLSPGLFILLCKHGKFFMNWTSR